MFAYVSGDSSDLQVPGGGYMRDWSDSNKDETDINANINDLDELVENIVSGAELVYECIVGLLNKVKKHIGVDYCESCGSPEDECEKCEDCGECINDCECEYDDE